MTEFLVLRTRENSCALKELHMELMVEKSGMRRKTSFNISSLSLVFSNLIIVLLGVLLFIFLLLVFHWVSCTCGFAVFVKFGKFSEMFFRIVFLYSPPPFSKSSHIFAPQAADPGFFFLSIFFSLWLYFVFISTSPSSSSLIISFAESNLLLIQSSVFLFEIYFWSL